MKKENINILINKIKQLHNTTTNIEKVLNATLNDYRMIEDRLLDILVSELKIKDEDLFIKQIYEYFEDKIEINKFSELVKNNMEVYNEYSNKL